MSKKSKKVTQTRQSAAGRPSSAARSAPAKSRARAAKPTTRINTKTIRIAAGVLAALSVAGFVSLLVTQAAPYTAGVVVELVLLALVAGFSIFSLIRPDMTVRWFFQPRR